MSSEKKYIPLKEIFKAKRGNSKYTKNYCNLNKGEYEVYTGTTIGSFGKIKTFDYETPNLTYTTDGEYAGTVTVLSGKYNVGGHRAILVPIKDDLCLEYFANILEPIFSEKKRSNCVPTLTWEIIKDLLIPVPINKLGLFDYSEQKKISDTYEIIKKKRQTLLENKKKLQNIEIELDLSTYKYKSLKIREIFDLDVSTNNSKFTKGFIRANAGKIPVYGASKIEEEVGYGYVKEYAEIIEEKKGKKIVTKIKYFENCLTYNIDGSAGYVFYRIGKFSLSEKVRPLIIFEKYKDWLDLEYLKYVIQPIFRSNIRGRKGPNGENEFSKINKTIIQDLEVQIPIDEEGNFDLEAQKSISQKYKRLEHIKRSLKREVEAILNVTLCN